MKRDLWPPNLKMPNNMAPLCGPFRFSGPKTGGIVVYGPPLRKIQKTCKFRICHFFLKIWVFGKNVEKNPTLKSILRLISAKNIRCHF